MSSQPYPTNAAERWLYAHGFERGNPFKTTNADEERNYLAEALFVAVPHYDLIRGPQTVLVFAPRGGGKSSLRVRLAAIALPEKADASTLAVECTDFEPLLPKFAAQQKVAEADFAALLLAKAAAALLAAFTKADGAMRSERATAVRPEVRAMLAGFLRQYAPHLLQATQVFSLLRQLTPAFVGEWADFQTAVSQKSVNAHLKKQNLPATAHVAWLLADLCDAPEEAAADYLSTLAAFEQLVALARQLQIERVDFLIDRLDEMQIFANDYEAQASLLEPLLAYLHLMELPGVAFKFFVAQELYQVLLERPSVRRDRLLNKAIKIVWDAELLQNLLNERLLFFSDDTINSLVLLCQQDGEQIEAEMLNLAMGSPRRLLTAGQLLCQVHASSRQAGALLTRDDWQAARKQLLQLMPPTLRLRLDEGQVHMGSERIRLTKTEQRIMETLTAYGGYCDRESFTEAVWGSIDGVTNEAVDQAVNRLRQKLDDNGPQPIYLQTVRGKKRGFRLKNYELLD